jgi:hypothetical protein
MHAPEMVITLPSYRGRDEMLDGVHSDLGARFLRGLVSTA